MLHALKSEIGYFAAVMSGEKTFEVRKYDRPFKVDDELVLQEFDPKEKAYTGREWFGRITHLMDTERFCKKGFCILSIKSKESYD